jgi:hypothetical protein
LNGALAAKTEGTRDTAQVARVTDRLIVWYLR